MKAIILVRVSTREQEDGHSLAAQMQRLRDYCKRKDFEVIKEFELVESSTRGGRHEFMAMLDFARKQKETIAIVADAVDRVQRSFKEIGLLDDMIAREVIELHFNRERMVIGKASSPTDIMMWRFLVMSAESYVLQLKENVKRSIEFKVRNGEATGSVPPGYLNVRDAVTGKHAVVLDPERAPIIRHLFEEYATGLYSLPELVKRANDMGYRTRVAGKPLSRSTLHQVIQNPFYYGQMKIKGVLHDHGYDPLIDKDVFDACHAVRMGWDKTPFQYRAKDFVFRGLVKCAVTGRMAYSDEKRKANGATYTYLVVADPENPARKVWVPEKRLLDDLAGILKKFEAPENVMVRIREWLRSTLDMETAYHREQVSLLEKQLSTVRTRLSRLTELMVDGAISPDEHKQFRNDLMEQRLEVTMKLEQHQKGDDGFVQSLETLVFLMTNAHRIFMESSGDDKRRLLKYVFSNLELKGKNLEFSLVRPLDLLYETGQGQDWLPQLDRIRTNPALRQLIITPPISLYVKEMQHAVRWAA